VPNPHKNDSICTANNIVKKFILLFSGSIFYLILLVHYLKLLKFHLEGSIYGINPHSEPTTATFAICGPK